MQRIGVFVCHCGSNIAATVDVKKVVEMVQQEPGVVHAEDYQYMCSEAGQAKIAAAIKEKHLTGMVVCSCSPRMHETTFRNAAKKAGLNPYMVEIANIREHCSWIHKDMEEATKKAVILARAAIAKVNLNAPLTPGESQVTKRALVIGGGIADIYVPLQTVAARDKGDVVRLFHAGHALALEVLYISAKVGAAEKALNIAIDAVADDVQPAAPGEPAQQLLKTGIGRAAAVRGNVGVLLMDAVGTYFEGAFTVSGEEPFGYLRDGEPHNGARLRRGRDALRAVLCAQGMTPALGNDAAGVPQSAVKVKNYSVYIHGCSSQPRRRPGIYRFKKGIDCVNAFLLIIL